MAATHNEAARVAIIHGWYCKWDGQVGVVRCGMHDFGARPDVNRVYDLWVSQGRI